MEMESKETVSASHQSSVPAPQTEGLQSSEKILNTVKEEGKPKYAGKFDTVEALEEGYRNSSKVHQENIDLKKQLEGYAKVPEDYQMPESVKMEEGEVRYLKSIAKKAGLNQDQFSKTVAEIHSASVNQEQQFDARRKELGEKNLILLQEYVKTVHPEDKRLQDLVLNSLIMDETSRSKALEHRNKLLNSEVPGMDKPTITATKDYEGNDKEYNEAYKAVERNPRDQKALEKFIKMSKERGEARFGEQIKQMRS